MINVKEYKGFNIFFEALEEDMSVSELFPEDTEEQIKEIEENNVVFCARVSAVKNGIELASDFLGGCVYKNEEEFYTAEGCYFDDMVNTVVTEAKECIKKLNG
tara:strand:- start:1831 stop:2139 length:309 start_codon:yes stop_codon:yes gene_type:complete